MQKILKKPLDKKAVLRKLSAADYITLIRILCTAVLVFLKPLSVWYYVMYSLAGASDVADGAVARATKTSSEFGAKLDSIADLLFYSVTLIKILPILVAKLPTLIWYAVTLVLLIRTASYITAAVKYRRFASQHTYMNKLTGLMIFMVPYMLNTAIATVYCITACVIGGLASLEELLLHLLNREYNIKFKSIFSNKK